MKKIIIFLGVVIFSFIWTKNWVESGKMDQWLQSQSKSYFTPHVLYGLAQIYKMKSNPKIAAYYFKWIQQEYPNYQFSDQIHWQLGQCYEDLSDPSSALEQYLILTDSHSKSKYSSMAKNRLGALKY